MSAKRTILAGPIVAPSILSADFAKLDRAVAIVDPARDWVHCDVMDNHFVPNLTFGPLIVKAVRAMTSAFLDVHLMIERPERLVDEFEKAGADQLTVHVEAPHDSDVAGVLRGIRENGMRAGLAIKPGTAIEAAEPFLDAIDLLLVMTVEPGFGGQSFMSDMMSKVRTAHSWRAKRGLDYRIEVDGGVDRGTAPTCRKAGADVFVAGSAVFQASDPVAALGALRKAIA